ncbi:cupin domain-containing protein [Aquipuribacter nitratireducens]|uniref:Cupin domain-containing protein n=1 Tax=Aquipuribacter nitratireducens TaxID=650104 RepID=A0ABW0GKR6_9MICO
MTVTPTPAAAPLAPGQGAHHRMVDGDHVAKALVEDACGAFEVFEVVAEPGPPAPPHVSPWSGVLFVLEGTVRVHVEDARHDMSPGATITLPAGTSCTVEVPDGAPSRFLAVTSGTGAGRFFADFARSVALDRPLAETLPEVLAVTRRHGVVVSGAPQP